MFTDCPSCERVFRIRAAQLRAADGWVRCGYCEETFYALERLYDTPVKKPPILHQAEKFPEQPPEEAVTAIPQQEQVPPDGDVPERTSAPPPQTTSADEATESQQEATEAETAAAELDRELLAELPPAIAIDYEDGKTEGSRARITWAGLIVILSVSALAQVAWFNRDRLLREYPELMPWAEKLCERVQCDLIRFRDLSAISLLNREVRLHPRFVDALLVSAAIVNVAEYIQPYPEIELVIYATNGQAISQGRFKPVDYLGPDTRSAAGMPPGVPIQFVLELAGAAQEAVSFEFQFH